MNATDAPTGLALREIDLRAASNEDYAALNEFFDVLRRESRPDDPLPTLEERVAGWRNIPSFVGLRMWVLQEAGSHVVGAALVQHDTRGENPHVVQYGVDVLPEARRHGLGTRLLTLACTEAEALSRRLMITSTSDRVPAGEHCMDLLGGERGLCMRISQLKLSELRRDLVREWIARAPERAGGYTLAFWDGAFPEERLQAIADLFDVMNTAPREDLDVEDQRMTPERLREIDRYLLASGQQRWVAYAVEEASGALAGFSELFWYPSRPQLLQQGNTGVFPAHRNHGLGRWLKAAVLERVLRELPEAELVRTGNAESNAAMLAINVELGFKPYAAETIWQVPVEQVRAYLNAHGVN